MLPGRAAGTLQDVGGTRFNNLFQWFCAFRFRFRHRPSPKLHGAFAEKRHTNNDVERRRIAMPPDRSSGRIISHQDLSKFFCIAFGKFTNALSQ